MAADLQEVFARLKALLAEHSPPCGPKRMSSSTTGRISAPVHARGSLEGTVYGAGQSFVDRGDAIVHIARNESLLNEVELWATYLVPGAPGEPFRLDEPAPSGCG